MNFSKFKAKAMKSSSSYVGQRDAGAIAAKRMRDKEQQKYVGFLPANESIEEAVYTGPNKEDRKVIKKLDNKDFAKKAAEYEKNMDPKKRQELKG